LGREQLSIRLLVRSHEHDGRPRQPQPHRDPKYGRRRRGTRNFLRLLHSRLPRYPRRTTRPASGQLTRVTLIHGFAAGETLLAALEDDALRPVVLELALLQNA